MSKNDDLKLRISTVARGDRGNAKNTVTTWAKLRDRLSRASVDEDINFAQYSKLSTDKKGKYKDVGAFVLGQFDEGKRKRENIHARCGIALDIDDIEADDVAYFKDGDSELNDYEFFAYTTRSHSDDKPKWRLVFPTQKEVKAEEFAAASRILASRLLDTVERSMDATDDVSFRVAQIMYWPSRSSDQEFDSFYNPGRLLDHEELLNDFGDWHDWTKLPFSVKRGQKRPTDGKKAEDPRTKKGIVGAFCRVYDVPKAIAKFIPEIYKKGKVEGGKLRYTYAMGSGANGAVVEDGGLFLYSHHGTDPCGERLVNAFDLIRTHLFGDRDADTPDGTNPTSFPSFKAFEEFLEDDEPTKRQLMMESLDIEAMFEDLDSAESVGLDADLFGDTGDIKVKATDWLNNLEIDGKGQIKNTLHNVAQIISNDERFSGCVEKNVFAQKVVTRQALKSRISILPHIPVHDVLNGDGWTDEHDACVRAVIESPHGKGKPGYGMKVADRDLKAAIDLVAAKRAFHPIQDYLNRVRWDGVHRVDTLFIDYLGEEDSPYTRQAARMWLVAAVARAFEPGHKFDYVPILEGSQGLRKSTFVEVLSKGHFGELHADLHDRKAVFENIQGCWIVEVPELQGFSRSDINAIKQMFSATSDNVRLAYEKRSTDFKRQCVFMGTTNDEEYLRDQTGARRFWPVKASVPSIDTDRLKKELDMVWAEATAIYREMRTQKPSGTLPLYLSDPLAEAIAKERQEGRRVETADDDMAAQIGIYLEKEWTSAELNGFDDLDADPHARWQMNEVCGKQLWVEALKLSPESYAKTAPGTVAKAMKKVKGWVRVERSQRTTKYGVQKIWRRAEWHNKQKQVEKRGITTIRIPELSLIERVTIDDDLF